MRVFNILKLLPLGIALSGPGFALTDETFVKLADQAFAGIIAEHDIPGMAVGVTIDGQHHMHTFGVASRKSGVPVTADTLFELGSVSKIFNATLAALAHERGALDLYAPVSDFEPALEGSAFDRITMMDLATHRTDGLPLQVPGRLDDEKAVITWLKDWEPDHSPSPMRSYSNVSTGLLGRVTAQSFGRSYTEAAQTVLFPMLGLENTWINVPDAARPDYAFGTSRKDNSEIRVNPGVFDAASYGVKSSAGDMLRFLDVSLGHGAVPADLRSAVERTLQGQTRTEYYTQAMIWEYYPWPSDLDRLINGNSSTMALKSQPVTLLERPQAAGRDVFFNKTGSTNGFGAYVALLPARNTGVIVLANRNYPNADRVKATQHLIRLLEENG